MRTIVDVIRAVSGVVETTFGAPPTTKDVTEGFSRPTTYVEPTQMGAQRTGGLRQDSYAIQITHFAPRTRSGYLGLLEAQGRLAAALDGPVFVSERFAVYPTDVTFNLRREDMVLICTFGVDLYQDAPDPDADKEMMKELHMQRKE